MVSVFCESAVAVVVGGFSVSRSAAQLTRPPARWVAVWIPDGSDKRTSMPAKRRAGLPAGWLAGERAV